ncbi:MAG: DUF2332 domain-containing protein [Deltaproteobacteria bacterium]|nr:DUF2332 domain-containing protein [Deltaproteobacteria bacterium]MBW2394429.1 DUF2332 domain-containing protein [Deltaproteobacteria bacterium]
MTSRSGFDLDRMLTAFRLQAGLCRHLGSPFYAELVQRAHDDLEAGGPLRDLVCEFHGDPLRGFLPLRVLAGVHALVLEGAAPELAAYYPTAGGTADAPAAWPCFRAVVEHHRDQIRPRLENAPQTNEVRRCAGLLGGFLQIAQQTRLPLRLLEIGCSAGLNLQWSRFRYELERWSWGDPGAKVKITTRWQGDVPPLTAVDVEIAERLGCDVEPRPIGDAAAARDLECFIWADQPERLTQLRAAIEVARNDPPQIERASAGQWLPDRLADPQVGICTVVYHSSVWTYLTSPEQQTIRSAIEARGADATKARPLAWLRAEDSTDGIRIELRLRTWPDGRETLLGEGHPHGRVVHWRPEAA